MKNKTAQRLTDAVLAIGRRTYWHPTVDVDRYGDASSAIPMSVNEGANLVSSRIVGRIHAPAIDLDFPVHVVPSSTPGHSHLYLDRELLWDQYLRLLEVLVEIGYVEPGYLLESRKRGQTQLRLPGVHKDAEKVAARDWLTPPAA